MDIEALIKREAPKAEAQDADDFAYAGWLRSFYKDFKDYDKHTLQALQQYAQKKYAAVVSHETTARCIVIAELLK